MSLFKERNQVVQNDLDGNGAEMRKSITKIMDRSASIRDTDLLHKSSKLQELIINEV